MKISLILVLLITTSLVGFSQKDSQKLPPFEMLPQKAGETKNIFELPYKTIYQVYDIKGKTVRDSIGEFIDLTLLNKGIYFISYDGLMIKHEKKTAPPLRLIEPKKCN